MRQDLTMADLPPMSQEEKEWWEEHNPEYYHYFYRIDNMSNGKFYYGIHSQRIDSGKKPEDDGYMGSGVDLKKAQNEEGIENFKKTVVKTFSTRDEARLEEMMIVDEDMIKDPMCYNLVLGGGGGIVGFWITDGTINRRCFGDDEVPEGWTKGRTISEKDRETMIKCNKVKYINKITLEVRFLTKEEYASAEKDVWFTESFFNSGRFVEYGDIQKIFSETNSWEAVSRALGIYIESIRKIRDYYISKGYTFTSDVKRSRPKDLGRWSSRMSGKMYINNGKIYKVIDAEDLYKYSQAGWSPGRTFLTEKETSNIISEFLEMPSIRGVARKLHKSDKSIKDALGFDGSEKAIWARNGDKITRTKIPNHLLDEFLKLGWKMKTK